MNITYASRNFAYYNNLIVTALVALVKGLKGARMKQRKESSGEERVKYRQSFYTNLYMKH